MNYCDVCGHPVHEGDCQAEIVFTSNGIAAPVECGCPEQEKQ